MFDVILAVFVSLCGLGGAVLGVFFLRYALSAPRDLVDQVLLVIWSLCVITMSLSGTVPLPALFLLPERTAERAGAFAGVAAATAFVAAALNLAAFLFYHAGVDQDTGVAQRVFYVVVGIGIVSTIVWLLRPRRKQPTLPAR